MARGTRKAQRANTEASGVHSARGDMTDLAWYLFDSHYPLNFVMSGHGSGDDRYRPLTAYLSKVIGRWPVVVLYSGDPMVEAIAAASWKSLRSDPSSCPFWEASEKNKCFEPLYGMSEMQAVRTLRILATTLGYSVTPRFERVAHAYLRILYELGIPISLSGLCYLCEFHDMGEFRENLLALPSGPEVGRSIWADLGIEGGDSDGQFDLFRAVISNLAHDASFCGWNSDQSISTFNCREAILHGGVYLQYVDNSHGELLIPYFTEELREASSEFILLLWDIRLSDESLSSLLSAPQSHFRFGFVAENAVDAAGGEDIFASIVERSRVVLILKHGTGTKATPFSEAMGRFDAIKVDESMGRTRKFFSVLPSDHEKNVSVSTENRYRVMPEDIVSLGRGQAIVFDTSTDEIIYFN